VTSCYDFVRSRLFRFALYDADHRARARRRTLIAPMPVDRSTTADDASGPKITNVNGVDDPGFSLSGSVSPRSVSRSKPLTTVSRAIVKGAGRRVGAVLWGEVDPRDVDEPPVVRRHGIALIVGEV
jgi:hypothetical protein